MRPPFPSTLLHGVFVLSGVSALIYQLVWQRALLMIYGSNSESVAMVVAAFLSGLGIGSLVGGWVSKWPRVPLVALFGAAELGVGAYGLISLKLFDAVGSRTAEWGQLGTGLAAFALVFLPTLLMGATLPLLVAHQVRETAHVGASVSRLYFVNTLGAALGAFIAARWLLGGLGMAGTVRTAAVLNASAAALIFLGSRMGQGSSAPAQSHDAAHATATASAAMEGRTEVPFRTALLWSAISGFLTLSWEIVWSRVFNFASASLATAFGMLLACYLLGLALGSLWSGRLLKSSVALRASLGRWVLLSGLASFAVAPLTALCAVHLAWWWGYAFVIVAGTLLGVTFPLLCHAAVPADAQSGSRLSFLYLANIIGSGLGSLLTGFGLLEWMPLTLLMLALAVAGAIWARWIAGGSLGRVEASYIALPLLLGLVGGQFYERLQFKHDFSPQNRFTQVVESRHGVVALAQDGRIHGNGVYDGGLKTKLGSEAEDWLVRPYFLSAVRDKIEKVLVIGVAGGAWTQIMVNHPQVQQVTAVEISHAYMDILRTRPEVRGLLTHPKLRLVIDDGRRWLRQHPEERFDAIVMNTTYHWREFAGALLSREFLTLVSQHLEPQGIALWNCTGSERAARTALDVFPHTMMVMNFCLVSHAPLQPDRARWERTLAAYRIEGEPVFDLTTIQGHEALAGVLRFIDREKLPAHPDWWCWCGRAEMERAYSAFESITDDNLGHEYLMW
ncbi:MAG: spermidine synthase [Verrucomicrobiaceae bacterium]|nr:spermidine synthase [Verrucomicrobiaceae bacterium]